MKDEIYDILDNEFGRPIKHRNKYSNRLINYVFRAGEFCVYIPVDNDRTSPTSSNAGNVMAQFWHPNEFNVGIVHPDSGLCGQSLHEAKHYLHDERWFNNAMQVAQGNLDRAPQMQGPNEWRSAEVRYWQNYVDWLNQHKKQLQLLWNEFEADRNQYLDAIVALIDRSRLLNAETWSASISPEGYREYAKFVHNHIFIGDDVQHDYLRMASNAMLDILGSLQDER
jgi:hypothetical protein